jgi:hypothetical protein
MPTDWIVEATETMEAVARNLNQGKESIRAMIEQQEETNAMLVETLVALGGSPPKPSLRLVEGADA